MQRIETSHRHISVAITLSFLSWGLVGHSSANELNEKLTIGITQEFESLNPINSQMVASRHLYFMAAHPLVFVNHDWQWACKLCKTLPTIKNGLAEIKKEGKSKKLFVHWELKPGLVWGDGQPITGFDFKLGWEVGNNPNITTASKELFHRIERVTIDKKNPRKFTTVFREVRYDYYQIGQIFLLPTHIEGPIYERTKDKATVYEKQTAYNTDPLNPGLYSGPYLVKELKLGSHVILEQNPKYYGQKPAIKTIIFKLIPNTQTLEANLLSGTIDMISELGISFDQALAFEKRLKEDPLLQKRFKILFADGLVYEHIDLNLRNPVLADANVRKALVYSIDRDKLVNALFQGRQKKAKSNIHPRDVYFTDDVVEYPYDPKKASALLDAAGWKIAEDGFRRKDGAKLALTIMTTAQNKTRELVEVFLQEQWKKVGIAIEIKNEPARVFFGETTRKIKFTGLAMYAWLSQPDLPPRSMLHSDEIPTSNNGYRGQNFTSWRNKRVDELFDKVVLEFDLEKRKKMMAEIQKAYTDEVPVIPLYMRAEIAVIPKSLRGFQITGHQYPSVLDADKWRIEEKSTGH
jgi:peptide/nickel transport system substrate-binding protein